MLKIVPEIMVDAFDAAVSDAVIEPEVSVLTVVGVNVLSKSEDIANARITFENKCVANLNVSRVSLKKLREIRLFQQGTYMSLDYMNQKGHVIRIKGMTEIIPEEVPIEKHEPLKSELASFADCVVNKKKPKVDAKFGQTALEVALEITRQIREQMIAEGSIQ